MFPGKTKMATMVARIKPQHIITFIACVYLLLITCYFIFTSLSNGLSMDSYAADGTFQLYNPMRRLLSGEILGKDFPVFHGVGVPLLHFPLFYLLGHNVFAADATKWLMSPLVFLSVSFLFFLAFFRKISNSLIATAALTIISLIYVDVVWPGNSLLGIRTALPIVVAAFMLWRPNFKITIKKYSIPLYQPITFLLLALSVACGTEQGLAAIIAYMTVELIRAIRSKTPFQTWWWHIGLKVIGVVLTTYILIAILTLGHPNQALYYALVDIPNDQGWYFGTPPNDFLSWNTLGLLFDKRVLFFAPILLLGAITFSVGVWRKILSKREIYVLSFLIIYGVVVFFASITGYWAPNAQLVPLNRVLSLILVAVVVRICMHYISDKQKTKHWTLRYLPVGLALAACLAFGWYSFKAYQQLRSYPIHQILHQVKDARHAPDGTYVSTLWKDRIDAFAPYIPQGARIWSTYTSIYDSMRGQLNGSSSGEDYIIHALGPQRIDQYAQDFITQKPDFVITLKPSYFPYEEWLWDRQWPFYQQLLTHYKIITDNDSHILWQRQDNSPAAKPSQTTALKVASDNTYRLSPGASDHVRLYSVTVNYTVKKSLPLTNKLSRYLINLSGTSIQRYPIALPPYETSWQFPVILAPGDSSVKITPSTEGIGPKSQLNVSSVTYQEIPITNNNSYPFYDSYCSFGGNYSYANTEIQYLDLKCEKDQLNFHYFQSKNITDVFSQ